MLARLEWKHNKNRDGSHIHVYLLSGFKQQEGNMGAEHDLDKGWR